MLLLLVAIVVNVLIAICFKMFALKKVDSMAAIVYNYIICSILGSLIAGEIPIIAHGAETPWVPYSLLLGTLFVMGFNLAALSIKYTGITVTSVMQRMSLLLSAGFAIIFFHEAFGGMKGLGILLAVVAVVLINKPETRGKVAVALGPKLIYPVGILLFSGTIEIILFYINVKGYSLEQDLELTTYAFTVAAILGSIYIGSEYMRGRRVFRWKDLLGGVALGLPNFFSIYLILMLLKQGFGGSVLFPVLNIGVLAASALVGIIMYREYLSKINLIGLIISLLAIVAIMLA